MAFGRCSMMALLGLAGLLHYAAAAQYEVGAGLGGWTFQASGSDVYSTKFQNFNLVVGDSLLFPFTTGEHNVYEVNPENVATCDATNYISMHTETNATITLATSGAHGFICEIPTHCTSAGMSLIVTVGGNSASVSALSIAPTAEVPISPPATSSGGGPVPSPIGVPVAPSVISSGGGPVPSLATVRKYPDIYATPADASSSRNDAYNWFILVIGLPSILLVCSMICQLKSGDPGTQSQLERLEYNGDSMLQLSGIPERITYKQLSLATRDFSEESKLGQGGFGSVYRGVLPDSGTPVAVKKISADSNQGEKEFRAEVSIITQLRHRNLIQLLGWCKDRDKYLLVYELMANGSLDKALFLADEMHSALSWPQRFNIITGAAAAVDYLHQGWTQQVIHRDIKAANIMLDDKWNAKLGDFGLARLVDHLRTAPTTLAAGTYGYIAPEAGSGRFTEKTDVFAFGAVVLEVACGRKAFDVHAPPHQVVLVDWVWQRLSKGDLFSVVDRRLGEDYDTNEMGMMLQIGLLCSHPNPLARPSMRHVVQILAGDAPVPFVQTSKPVPMFRTDSKDLLIHEFADSFHSFCEQ